jgi:hypothetical protein
MGRRVGADVRRVRHHRQRDHEPHKLRAGPALLLSETGGFFPVAQAGSRQAAGCLRLAAVTSAVQTALIAGGAAAFGAVLTLGGSIVTSRAAKRQTEDQIAADHAGWLRDRRAGLYVEMNRFIKAAANQRAEVIRAANATAELEQRAAAELAASEAPLPGQLSVEGTTFIGQQTAQAFDQALEANTRAWELFLAAVRASRSLALRQGLERAWLPAQEQTEQALAQARAADREVYRLIRLDVTYTEYTRRHLRARRAARRRQNRQITRLRKQQDGITLGSRLRRWRVRRPRRPRLPGGRPGPISG